MRDYGGLGIDRLVLVPPRDFWRQGASLSGFEAFVHANAPERLDGEPA